jgi:hypothetical protein
MAMISAIEARPANSSTVREKHPIEKIEPKFAPIQAISNRMALGQRRGSSISKMSDANRPGGSGERRKQRFFRIFKKSWKI